MILLYFIRYFAIINLNSNKKGIYQQFKIGTDIEKFQKIKMRVLKVFSGTWFTLGLLAGSYVLVNLVFLLTLAIDGFVCKFTTLVALRSINGIELIIIYILTLFALLVDIIPNLKPIFTGKFVNYLFSDPYWFRVQIFLFLPYMIFSLIFEIWSFATSFKYLDIVINHTATISLTTVSFAILVIIDVVFPLVITMIVVIKNIGRKKGSSNALVESLKDAEIMKIFEDFCGKEYSLENISCYNDMMNYKKSVKKPEDAKILFEKYLNGNESVMEINIPKKVCEQVRSLMNEGKFDGALFEIVEKDVIANLCDTFSRFVFDPPYLQYIANKKGELEMLEGKK